MSDLRCLVIGAGFGGLGVWSGCDNWYQQGDRITTNWPGMVGEYEQRLADVDWSALVSQP